MIELFYIFLATIIIALIYHFTYTWYKEREWRKNNPDEHKIMDRPVRKDPELGGPKGPEPTRYKTWESKGREIDF